jgi:RimJ/RimL family protein N-acetyltransferase
MDRFKIDLLKRSFSAGVVPFLSELSLMLKDKLFGPTYLVYEIRKDQHIPTINEMNSSLDICNYLKWEQVPEDIKSAIHEELDGQYWGKKEWMDLGWRLWVGTIDQKLAVLSWTREAGQCEDFFFPLSDGCVLIWQTITVPRYRGKALAPFMYNKVLRELFQWENLRVYVSCREFNLASKKNIEKSGFKYIGFGVVKKKTGQGIWYPVTKPFTQG